MLWKNFKSSEDILKHFYVKIVPVNVIGLARQMGIQVLQYPDLECHGILDFPTIDTPHIYVQQFDSFYRQRFVVSHIIGHLIFDDPKEQIMDTMDIKDWRERRANNFAMELLMPEILIQEHLCYGTPLSHMPYIYQVVDTTMQDRLSYLGYV